MFIKKALAQQGAHLLGEAIASEFLIRISGPAIPTNVFLMPLSQIGTGPALTGELHIDKAVLIIQEQRRGMWLVYSDDPEPIGAIETNNFLEFTIMSTTPIPKDIRFDSLDENNSNGAVALAATLLYLIQMGIAQMP